MCAVDKAAMFLLYGPATARFGTMQDVAANGNAEALCIRFSLQCRSLNEPSPMVTKLRQPHGQLMSAQNQCGAIVSHVATTSLQRAPFRMPSGWIDVFVIGDKELEEPLEKAEKCAAVNLISAHQEPSYHPTEPLHTGQ